MKTLKILFFLSASCFALLALLILGPSGGDHGAPGAGLFMGSSTYTKPDVFACYSKKDLELALSMLKSGDGAAYARLLMDRRCRDMSTVEVFITDKSIISGSVKVRPRGEANEYWMLGTSLR